MQDHPLVICLMGPTASGKTPLAIELVQKFPCEIISVDSAMIYRGMDIGTAKPTKDILQIAPHRLIDILDPKEIYSAGQFCVDAVREIKDIHTKNKIPLLVGGTMLYFRVLQQGIAKLPLGNSSVRAQIKQRAEQEGWPALHAYLTSVDPKSAAHIQPRDTQRIQRALEVYMLTGKAISDWHGNETSPLTNYRVINICLMPNERKALHDRIKIRFTQMLEHGFIDEVKKLYERGDLSVDLPSIRSVGYRQAWEYLAGNLSYDEMCEQILAATRQLAKRQITWLRTWPECEYINVDAGNGFNQVAQITQSVIRDNAKQ